MEALGALILLLGLAVFAALYQAFLEWLLPKISRHFAATRAWLPTPSNFCPRCEQAALKHAFHSLPYRSHPARRIPDFYLCEHCGARWLKLSNSPLVDASDPQYDRYYGPQVPYQLRGEPDNGNEPMEVVPNQDNWVRCPHCGWRFRLDTASQSGEWLLHERCGQRLKLVSI